MQSQCWALWAGEPLAYVRHHSKLWAHTCADLLASFGASGQDMASLLGRTSSLWQHGLGRATWQRQASAPDGPTILPGLLLSRDWEWRRIRVAIDGRLGRGHRTSRRLWESTIAAFTHFKLGRSWWQAALDRDSWRRLGEDFVFACRGRQTPAG